MRLRDYQQRAVDSIRTEFETTQSTLLVMPTGSGKTIVFAHVISQLSKKRVMVIAHREELIFQARDKIAAVTGEIPQIEMGSMRASNSIFGNRVVVASVQSLISGDGTRRVERFPRLDFDLVITDEAHHVCADSWRFVLDHFLENKNCKLLGCTATPDRADERALGQVFNTVAMDYEIIDAIEEGWLVPIMQRYVICKDMDLSQCRTTAGDLNGADLARVMEYEKVLHEIAMPTLEICRDRKAIIFASSVAHAERLCEIINRNKPGAAQWLCGETPKEVRREMLADFAANRFQFCCNVGVLTEGFDDPATEVIVQARPTKSRSLYSQMVGRATRPLPGLVDPLPTAEERREAIRQSAKAACEVIDFVGNCGKHKLASAADILGGNYDDDVIQLAERNAMQAGCPMDMRQALKDAARQRHEEQEQQKRMEEAKRANVRAKVSYSAKIINPFDAFEMEVPRIRGWDKRRPPSERQLALIEKQGIDPATIPPGQIGKTCGEIIRRFQNNLASFKQAKLLRRYGLPTANTTRRQASEWIDVIAKNNWRLPADIREQAEQLRSQAQTTSA